MLYLDLSSQPQPDVCMPFSDPRIATPGLAEAIDRHPLTVPPDTSLLDVLSCMSQTQSPLKGIESPSDEESSLQPIQNTRSSFVLITQGTDVAGIFTERDIVRLTARGQDFKGLTIAEVMTHPVITVPEADLQDVFAALFLFRRYQIRHLVVVNAQGQLAGVISPASIRQVLRPANLLKLRRVADVMIHQVIQAPMAAAVLDLAQLMEERRVSCVVITKKDAEEHNVPIGIVTERDLVQFQALRLDLAVTKAETVMSTPLYLLSPEDSLWTAHQQMQQRHVRRLVVSWNWGRDLGIVTQTSLLRIFDPMEMYEIIETLQRTVQQLEAEKAERLKSETEGA
jgi:CBS domain-containing protein